jgi:single-stranded-DNA-specific exonuclease
MKNAYSFWDYDVDGTTAVSLVSSLFKKLLSWGGNHIPDRYDEGYGISFKGIDYAEDNGFTPLSP